MQKRKDEILEFLKSLKEELSKEGIISLGLFGSFAKDSNSELSDIDIVYETSQDFIDRYRGWSAFTFLNHHLRYRIEERFNTHVDLFDLNSSSPLVDKIKKETLYV